MGFEDDVSWGKCRQQPVKPVYKDCAKSYSEGNHSCEDPEYAVCDGYVAGVKSGQCQPAPADPSDQNCTSNFGSNGSNACRNPEFRACVGHQAGSWWGKCLQLLPFDPSNRKCHYDKHCTDSEYPMCMGFEDNVSWGKCRQQPVTPVYKNCAKSYSEGNHSCEDPEYAVCDGYVEGVKSGQSQP